MPACGNAKNINESISASHSSQEPRLRIRSTPRLRLSPSTSVPNPHNYSVLPYSCAELQYPSPPDPIVDPSPDPPPDLLADSTKRANTTVSLVFAEVQKAALCVSVLSLPALLSRHHAFLPGVR